MARYQGRTIKDLPEDLRPRERMLAFGAQALSNAELLAILLRTGNPQETALEVAQRLLSQPGGLRYLAEVSLEELKAQKGIGLAKAAQIKAAIELGRRLAAFRPERPLIKRPADAACLLMDEMRYLDREHFRTISLNTKNRVLAIDNVAVGSLNSSYVHPREVFKGPVRRSAAAVILVHNHPSGDPAPSLEDIQVTRRLVEAGKVLGIEVLDHLILGDGSFVSMKEKGLL
ncbi:MAG: DNA repair protein RadC [Thermanaeromonas sp.]|uniref:RadC family protein n=1 Tax=Thermanaeromonas sp. TaxID=2003697 RepID=UPI00243A35C8|nr:DNA repair protein RadC [Thermanaeromonas sp.]MCG0278157.1 DNA repair protein RadC [Thermanaeromonas sp.]